MKRFQMSEEEYQRIKAAEKATKGETGTVEFSDKDYVYFGRVGKYLYEGVDLPELIDSFRGEVDRHYSEEVELVSYADEEFF